MINNSQKQKNKTYAIINLASSEIHEQSIVFSAVTIDIKDQISNDVFPVDTKFDEIFASKHSLITIPNFLKEVMKSTTSPWKYCANEEDFYFMIQNEGVFSLKTNTFVVKIKGSIPRDYPFKTGDMTFLNHINNKKELFSFTFVNMYWTIKPKNNEAGEESRGSKGLFIILRVYDLQN